MDSLRFLQAPALILRSWPPILMCSAPSPESQSSTTARRPSRQVSRVMTRPSCSRRSCVEFRIATFRYTSSCSGLGSLTRHSEQGKCASPVRQVVVFCGWWIVGQSGSGRGMLARRVRQSVWEICCVCGEGVRGCACSNFGSTCGWGIAH